MLELKFCTVCAANNNRSMEAHRALKEAGYHVDLFGTGTMVRLPGPLIDRPNNYKFGTEYDVIYKELVAQDPKLYRENGLLQMLERNRRIKPAPQRWQDQKTVDFDIVFTCEDRCFEAVLEDLMQRAELVKKARPLHVINLEIKDDHANAVKGGQGILELAATFKAIHQQQLAGEDTLVSDRIVAVLSEWQEKHPELPLLYSVCYE